MVRCWCAAVVRAISLFLLLPIRSSSSSCLLSASRKTQKKTEIIHWIWCYESISFTKGYLCLCLFFLFYTYRNYYTVQKEPSYSGNQRRDSSFPLWFKVFTIGYHYIFVLFLYPQEFVTLFRKKQHIFFFKIQFKDSSFHC